MSSWIIISSQEIARVKGTQDIKTKFFVKNEKENKHYVVLQWPNAPCIVYDQNRDADVSKFNWWYHRDTGYVYAHSNIIGESGKPKAITMHSYIMDPKSDQVSNGVRSIDHINQVKTFNIIENMRFSTQSEQNSNRADRADKLDPPPELVAIGITTMPRYIRYDKSEQKFVIETVHPGLGGKCYSGTKSKRVSIFYKYHNVLKKLQELNDSIMTPEKKEFIKKQEALYKEYCDISLLITGVAITDTVNYNTSQSTFDYKLLEEHFTDADRSYSTANVLPTDPVLNIESLPKYCSYIKASGNRGDGFYISRHHPHIKAVGLSDIKTSRSVTITTKSKYDTVIKILKVADENEGEALKAALKAL